MESVPRGLCACQLKTHDVEVISVMFGARRRRRGWVEKFNEVEEKRTFQGIWRSFRGSECVHFRPGTRSGIILCTDAKIISGILL